MNAEPKPLEQWREFLFSFKSPDIPMILSFTLEVTTNWAAENMERITVNYAEKCLRYWQKEVFKSEEYKARYPDGYVKYDIEHKYNNLYNNILKKLLFSASEMIEHKPWITSDLTKYVEYDSRPNSRFRFSACYHDGTSYIYEGWYDRRSIDEDSYYWGKFMSSVSEVISAVPSKYLLDKCYFTDMPRPGEFRSLFVFCELGDDSKFIDVACDNYNITPCTVIKVTEENGQTHEGKVKSIRYYKADGKPGALIKGAKVEVIKYDRKDSSGISSMLERW
jgi:hypothetical protein